MPGAHLTPFERGQIQVLQQEGRSHAYIAQTLGRSPSTIGRELRRNSARNGVYQADKAQKRYEERRRACRPHKRLAHEPLVAYVKEKMGELGWTPEQVAGRLALDFPADPRMRVSPETLYQAIYSQDRFAYLRALLPQARPKRRKRGQGRSRRGPAIVNRTGIEQRPAHVEQRREHGHWEGDTVVGKNQDGFILTLVERHSRFLVAVKTSAKNADVIAHAAIEALLDWPVSWVRTITLDNGSEFAAHEELTRQLGLDVYFAQPYASHQRGTNENTNGLIRRQLPKGMSFKSLTQRQLDFIVEQINNTPRKCLGYRTPNEVFQQQREKLRLALAS